MKRLSDILFSQEYHHSLFREFDPGSGRTLAACLTHASRAVRHLTLSIQYELADEPASGRKILEIRSGFLLHAISSAGAKAD